MTAIAAAVWLDNAPESERSPEGWELPLDTIEDMHRDRIDPEFAVQPFTVECWHAGQVIPTWSVVITGGTDDANPRDLALHAVKVMSEILHPDFIVLTMDTHMSSSPNNPKTGQPWAHGEMQNACDDDGACLTGVIRDNLVVHTLRLADGTFRMRCMPYHVEEDGTVTRFEEQVMSEWGKDPMILEGIVADAFRELAESWKEARVWNLSQQASAALGIEPLRARLHAALAGVRLLNGTSQDLVGAEGLFEHSLLAHGQEEVEIIADSLRRAMEPDLADEQMAAIREVMSQWLADADAEAEKAKAGE